MDTLYNPRAIEQEAQEFWDKNKCFKVIEDLNKEKYYCLSMFPYPSGTLHMGHVRNYTLGDVISRYQRILGKNVLQPTGWDAFGLPAENAAIKNKIPPAEWTRKNIATMRQQFKHLGFAYDWKREISTCEPEYYRWEQWFFIQLFKKGLAYKKHSMVNWDPVDQTVLANEQVVDGRGWRSGALIERREIAQWFLKITEYADELLHDLDTLEYWPDQVKQMQRNWIGRSEGLEITFKLAASEDKLTVYTTRADTLMGVTYLAIASDHPLALKTAKQDNKIQEFIQECKNIKVSEAEIATLDKKGIAANLFAVHPITGKQLPIWIANFVLIEYGSGAVMSVPAHDQRDWEFAKLYQLPVAQVISPGNGAEVDLSKQAFTEKGILINSNQFDNLSSQQACEEIANYLAKNNLAQKKVHYRLRDWGVSRQRYWGAPIPMILCEACGPVPVPEEELPVVLPENITLTGSGNALQQCSEFVNTNCPNCKKPALRETDTFDTFIESSWYYARFACKNQDNAMLDNRAKYWTPVDQYVGGIEHAVMHLLYARFFHKLMRDENLLNSDEPFKHLLTQGMVLKDGAKMSKSKGNVVDPELLMEKYGADTVRFFIIFAAPPEQSLEWSDSGVEGSFRFLKRLWHYAQQHAAHIIEINDSSSNGSAAINWDEANQTIKFIRRELYEILSQALYDFQRNQFNTVASACMKLLNTLMKINDEDQSPHAIYLIREGLSILLRILSPITPHICHKLWSELKYGKLILDSEWPKVIKDAIRVEKLEYIVQVNGKLRGHINVALEADEKDIVATALSLEAVQRALDGQTLKKQIVIKSRKLVNLVV